MAQPQITLTDVDAANAEVSSIAFGNVNKGASSSTRRFRFQNNLGGSSAVSDAEECQIQIRNNNGTTTGTAGVTPGQQVYEDSWSYIAAGLTATPTYLGNPCTFVEAEVLGEGDGATATFSFNSNTTAPISDDPSSEAVEDQPAVTVRRATAWSGTATTWYNASNQLKIDAPSAVPGNICWVISIVNNSDGAYSFDLTNVSFSGDTITIDMSQGSNSSHAIESGDSVSVELYYWIECTWNSSPSTTSQFSVNAGVYGATPPSITFGANITNDEQIEVDYFYRSPTDFEAIGAAGDKDVGGWVPLADMPDNDQAKGSRDTPGSTSASAGTSTWMGVIKDNYTYIDNGTPYGFAEFKIYESVPVSAITGTETFKLRLSYAWA